MIGVFSGREITTDDMELIKWARKSYPNLSRYELAGTVCELIGWVTPAGEAKIPQCMAFFAQMETGGKLDLPALKIRKPNPGKEKPSTFLTPDAFTQDITNCDDIELCIARPGSELQKWRGYINAFHLLGDKMVFGSRLHYFIRSGSDDLGCLQFSAASWALDARDKWIGWSEEDRKYRLFLVVNNSRFLILPNVHIKNLASRVLSLAVKQIQIDWMREFGYSPVLLETFVDPTYYNGTSYKAANWTFLGYTKGRGRMDRHHNSHLSSKAIYAYSLRSDFADILKGVKPYKIMPPL
jgi:hypothetical protein